MHARLHGLIRLLSLAALAGGLSYMAQRSQLRADLTAEGLSEITEETRTIFGEVDGEHPVLVTAFISEEVPRAHVATRARLLNILREMQASGGPGLTVRIVEAEAFSEAGQEAIDKFGILPRSLVSREAGRIDAQPTFLGLAMTSGPREEVIPFFDRGASVEYEVARALHAVTRQSKPTVGIVRNDVKMMGDFDLQARKRIPPWRIVEELRRQYEVQSVVPDAPIKKEIDVLLVPQVSSLTQPQLDNLSSYLLAGRPALIVADPMPDANVALVPREPLLPPPGQQMGRGAGDKGDYLALLASIGVSWLDEEVVFDTEKPDPRFDRTIPFLVFAGDRPGDPAFTAKGPIVDGLSSVVTIFPGVIGKAQGAAVEFTPLLRTGPAAGRVRAEEMLERHPFFGVKGPRMPRNLGKTLGEAQIMGARVRGGGDTPVEAIVLADLDMFGDEFFVMAQRGGDVDGDGLVDERFDNVSFLLNCIDTLAGEDRFIELRKRQPAFRRLEKVAELTREAREARESKIEEANAVVDAEVVAAQAALDAQVEQIMARSDVDAKTKEILAQSARAAEQRRFDAQKTRLEREKARALEKIELEHQRAVDEVRDEIRVASILLPPLPALALGLLIFWRKRRREMSVIPADRRAQAGGPEGGRT